MLRRAGMHKWRAGVVSRAVVSVSVGLLVLTGVLPLKLSIYLAFTSLALLHYVLIWWASPRAGVWLDWVSLVFDLGITVALLQFSGRTESPLAVLVYLWWFGIIMVNARFGELHVLAFFSVLGWITLALGGYGGPGYTSFLAVHTMAMFLFALTSLMLMDERRQGQLDPLTRVLHRGAGLERLSHWIDRREPFDLAFVDLKDFKHINDRHGHIVGDEVLRILAERLRRSVRKSDLVIRYGGDEFLVAGPKGILAERMQRVFSKPVATSAGCVSLVGDHGVVTWEPWEDPTLETLLARADAAMYRMKYTEPREDSHETQGGRPQRA